MRVEAQLFAALQGLVNEPQPLGIERPAYTAAVKALEAFEAAAEHPSNPNPLVAALEGVYEEFGDFRASWPGRDTPRGQSLLCNLRGLIAATLARTEQDVQDDYGTRAARRERGEL